jgi:hypothetical protein
MGLGGRDKLGMTTGVPSRRGRHPRVEPEGRRSVGGDFVAPCPTKLDVMSALSREPSEMRRGNDNPVVVAARARDGPRLKVGVTWWQGLAVQSAVFALQDLSGRSRGRWISGELEGDERLWPHLP